jgi:peptide-methionine (R)-S-oxide reductase
MPAKVEIGPIVKVTKTDAEWKKLLSLLAYRVLRHEDTERAFANPLHENHQAGIYYCAGCDLPLFSSEHKFDSGTGWPSFWQPLDPKVIETRTDSKFFMARVEVHCATATATRATSSTTVLLLPDCAIASTESR